MRAPSASHRRRLAGGAAAIEFAILVMPLLLMVFGVVEFGRAFYTYNSLLKGARDAARHLTIQTPGDPTEHAVARCLVVHGNPDCTGPVLAPNLTTAMVQTCDAVLTCDGISSALLTPAGTINTVLVRITGYTYDSALEVVAPDIDFSNINVLMRSQL